ncbi:MAG: hypothetical protein Q9227_007531 [Pyrenula ochraceoflavens]
MHLTHLDLLAQKFREECKHLPTSLFTDALPPGTTFKVRQISSLNVRGPPSLEEDQSSDASSSATAEAENFYKGSLPAAAKSSAQTHRIGNRTLNAEAAEFQSFKNNMFIPSSVGYQQEPNIYGTPLACTISSHRFADEACWPSSSVTELPDRFQQFLPSSPASSSIDIQYPQGIQDNPIKVRSYQPYLHLTAPVPFPSSPPPLRQRRRRRRLRPLKE